MRLTLAVLLYIFMAFSAFGKGNLSTLIADKGLSHALRDLQAIPKPSANEHFAIAGLIFLHSIEKSMQQAYDMGLNLENTDLPLLALPIPHNPDPSNFSPDIIDNIFRRVQTDMDQARHNLKFINPSDTVSVPIDLADIWFDIDQNGQRSDSEDILPLLERSMGWNATSRLKDQAGNAKRDWSVTVVFDLADTAWLHAYTHFLSAFSDFLLAFSTTGPITEVMTAAVQSQQLLSLRQVDRFQIDKFIPIIDILAVFLLTFEQTPDPELTRSTQQHLLQMVAHNRIFWARAAKEADDNLEWIPNARQTSALGLDLPPNTGAIWLTVLADLEALVKGQLLLPHWRLGDRAGVNLGLYLQDPGPLDAVRVLQGSGIMPYAQKGTVFFSDRLKRFNRTFRRNPFSMMLYLQ